MIDKRFYGVTSLALASMGVAIAAVTAFARSWGWGAAYLAICAVTPPIVLYAYCVKCPCRTHCGHVLPGKLAAAVFKARPPGPYTAIERVAVGGALSLLVGLPVTWLWRLPTWLALFLGLNLIAVVEIRAAICPGCESTYCPLRPQTEN